MYPTLETERLILRPISAHDFPDMFALHSNPDVVVTMEKEFPSNRSEYEKEFVRQAKDSERWTIRSKEADEFLGYFFLHPNFNTKGVVRHSHMVIALNPEHWMKGFATEATQEVLRFNFYCLQPPWSHANVFQNNSAAAQVLQKCGLRLHATYEMNHRPYDQYRCFRKDYLKESGSIVDLGVCKFERPVRKSPYSFEKPIRQIDSINYTAQPTEYLCGQSVIAMLAGVSVDEVIDVMQNDKGTSTSELRDAMCWYGFRTATKARQKYTEGVVLPNCCILSIMMPGYGHWALYYHGKYYDPEFGVLDALPMQARLRYFWEMIC